ncbi:MAG: lytic transglycosylase domain-containing protein [Ferruginibacter sp.]
MKIKKLNKKMPVITPKASLLTAVLFFFCTTLATGQAATDSTCPGIMVNDEAIATPCNNYGNIVFPAILKGQEENSIDYIEKFSSRRRDYLVRMYTKGKKLLSKAAGIFKKYNVPEELKVLLTLESAYNGEAVSRAGAVGYWQFMDAVAKEYGLKCVSQLTPSEKEKLIKKHKKKADAMIKALAKQKDERKNFNKSTIAAARYLRDRKVNLNENWLLVVASYNWGVGNVWDAMERSGKKNPTFWDIKKYVPAETQAYVMNFITLNVIFHNYDNFVKNKLVFTAEPNAITETDGFEKNITEAMSEPMASGLK